MTKPVWMALRASLCMMIAVAVTYPFCTYAFAQSGDTPFAGRWDFNIASPKGISARWLGVTEKNGGVEVWYQPGGGNVYPVKDVHVNGDHMSLIVSPASKDHPAVTWELESKGDKLVGEEKSGNSTYALTGVRAPELQRDAPETWTDPTPLFNGKDLDGWEPVGDAASSHWTVQGGMLVNTARGANLRTTRKFDDFKLHFEVSCPEDCNSGFYLRGRYEVQIESEVRLTAPVERRIGSIYGRIAPQPELPRTPGKWETFDITLVGRTVTEVHDGITTIDHKVIEGITGGALDADEGESGPFYIQGDHTGNLKYRNITVSVPKK
jgi:Domain of Unknown Function (DUF1080)